MEESGVTHSRVQVGMLSDYEEVTSSVKRDAPLCDVCLPEPRGEAGQRGPGPIAVSLPGYQKDSDEFGRRD